jgi:hypothetical protein
VSVGTVVGSARIVMTIGSDEDLLVHPAFGYELAVHGHAPTTLPTTVTSSTSWSASGLPSSRSALEPANAMMPGSEVDGAADHDSPRETETTATAETDPWAVGISTVTQPIAGPDRFVIVRRTAVD